jgi:hypothetical protein
MSREVQPPEQEEVAPPAGDRQDNWHREVGNSYISLVGDRPDSWHREVGNSYISLVGDCPDSWHREVPG